MIQDLPIDETKGRYVRVVCSSGTTGTIKLEYSDDPEFKKPQRPRLLRAALVGAALGMIVVAIFIGVTS